MKVHELKTVKPHFSAVWSKIKRMEIRNNDRNFQLGDVLHMREYDLDKKEYSGRYMLVDVIHILPGGQFGIHPDHCVMSIKIFRKIQVSDLPF
jgi:hypothetical protein